MAGMFTSAGALEWQAKTGRKLIDAKTKGDAESVDQAVSQICSELTEFLQSWVTIGKRSNFAEGCVLYWAETYWDDLAPLHGQYSSFHEFACGETGEDYKTWRMKIAIFRTFVLNEKNDPMINEMGADSFLDVPIGKLQKALGTVNKGEMSQNQWAALVDPNVNDKEFYHVMKALPEGTTREEEEERFVTEGSGPNITVAMDSGKLTYWPLGGQIGVELGWLNVQSKDDLVVEAIDGILAAVNARRV